jgi:hypothetical protein
MGDLVKPTHVFPVGAIQMQDITALLEKFSALDSDEITRGVTWGEGHRAVIGVQRIPIHTDALGITELLGWIQRNDFGWEFTQKEAQ